MKKVILVLGISILTAGAILIILPHVYVSKIVAEEYQVPKSAFVIGGWGPLIVTPAKIGGKGTYLNASDSLNIQVNATSGMGIDFYVNAVNESTNDVLATYLFFPDVTRVNTDWVVPVSSAYSFEFSSSSSFFTRDDVSLLVTKQWTETAYRVVVESFSLFPFEGMIVGIVLVIVGVAVSIYGVSRKLCSFTSQYFLSQRFFTRTLLQLK